MGNRPKQTLERSIGATLLRLSVYLAGGVTAFGVLGLLLFLMGFDVVRAYSTVALTSFSSVPSFIETLLKFIPLLLLALAFSIPAISGKWNIGGDGQFLLGAIGAVAVGILLANSGLPPVVLIVLGIIVSVSLGIFWAAIPAWLFYKFGVSEILTTVLLNFVSFQLVDYVTTVVWNDPTAGHPTTILTSRDMWLPLLISAPPLHSGIIPMAAGMVGIYAYVLKTTGGYELRATGANPRASRVYGINVRVVALLSLLLGGVFAGLAGGIEVAGVHHRLVPGMQSNFMVLGIIIGLISRYNLSVIPLVAFFIAVLEIGASAMQRTLMIPAEMIFITEALILLFVLLAETFRRRK